MEIILHHGDCLREMDKIDTQSVDLALTDLPYGTTACRWDTPIAFSPLWSQLNRICKSSAAMVFTAAMPFAARLIASNIANFRYEWVWEKPQGTNPLNVRKMPLRSHELVLVFYRKSPTYNPQMTNGTPYSAFSSSSETIGEVYGSVKSIHRDNQTGTRYPKTILRFKQEKGLHPTQKPVPLFEYLIRTYSSDNDVVLDPTMGSGTAGVACARAGRRFIGIEQDETYFNIARLRINDENAFKAVPSNDNHPASCNDQKSGSR